jgi:hypothetical protein
LVTDPKLFPARGGPFPSSSGHHIITEVEANSASLA